MALKAARRSLVRVLGQTVADVEAAARRRSREPVGLVLAYHGLTEEIADRRRQIVQDVHVEIFAAQLRYLSSRYRVVPLAEVHAAVAARRRGDALPVALTFDDDLASHVRLAKPILEQLGLPATFFLTGATLDRSVCFWWQRLQLAYDRGVADFEEILDVPAPGLNEAVARDPGLITAIAQRVGAKPLAERERISEALRDRLGGDPVDWGLREREVRELAEAGFEIGFHTLRHHSLPALEDAELASALDEGRARLASSVGRELAAIAYPHGAADARVAAAARRAGFARGYTTSGARVEPATDPLLTGRLVAWQSPVGTFGLMLARAAARGSGARLRL